jgi:hypothetical protein
MGEVSATTTISRSGSKPSFSRSKLAERFPVLLEVRRREVADFVLLQKGVDLEARLETQQAAKLSGRQDMRPVGLKREAFEGRTRQVLPAGFQSLCDVFRQFQRDMHGDPLFIISKEGSFSQASSKM